MSDTTALIINTIAFEPVFIVDRYRTFNPEQKRESIAELSQWVKDHARLTRSLLLQQQIASTHDFKEFEQIAHKMVIDADPALIPIIIDRYAQYPNHHARLLEMCYLTAPVQAVPQARQCVHDADPVVQTWAATILLSSVDSAGVPEGLALLEKLLATDKSGTHLYPIAFDALLATKNPRAIQLATKVLSLPPDPKQWFREVMAHHLLILGSPEAEEYVVRAIGSGANPIIDKDFFRRGPDLTHTEGDRTADLVVQWTRDTPRWDWNYGKSRANCIFQFTAPDHLRVHQRANLQRWIRRQAALIRAHQPAEIYPQIEFDPLRYFSPTLAQHVDWAEDRY